MTDFTLENIMHLKEMLLCKKFETPASEWFLPERTKRMMKEMTPARTKRIIEEMEIKE